MAETETMLDGFSLAHAGAAVWEPGLRPAFRYRDLGVARATGGRVGAHVIRATEVSLDRGVQHRHTLEAQVVYVLRGWIEFEYEGVGVVRLEPGSCVTQPPGIKHTEIAHSEDLEILEITVPAQFATQNV